MKQYFILEDHPEQAKALSKIIASHKKDVSITVAYTISEAMSLLHTTHTYDVFFLDIQLSTLENVSGNGISFGKLIRSQDLYRTTPIIFVTSYTKYINEAINGIHCYGFLTKPYLPEDVYQLLASLMPKELPARLKLKNSDCIYREIPFSDLVFIQSYLHYLHYHTIQDVHRSRQYTMKQLEKVLPDYFVRCHKSYYVNRHFISTYDSVNGCIGLTKMEEIIPVGRNYRDII